MCQVSCGHEKAKPFYLYKLILTDGRYAVVDILVMYFLIILKNHDNKIYYASIIVFLYSALKFCTNLAALFCWLCSVWYCWIFLSLKFF